MRSVLYLPGISMILDTCRCTCACTYMYKCNVRAVLVRHATTCVRGYKAIETTCTVCTYTIVRYYCKGHRNYMYMYYMYVVYVSMEMYCHTYVEYLGNYICTCMCISTRRATAVYFTYIILNLTHTLTHTHHCCVHVHCVCDCVYVNYPFGAVLGMRPCVYYC